MDLEKLKTIAEKIKGLPTLAKKTCRHCYGTGRIGFIEGIKALPVPCRCVLKKETK